jgi:hypothetical protein
MRYIVLYNHDCSACSRVAQLVRGLSVTGLEARARTDSEVAGLLSRAGLPTPDRPALLVADGDSVELTTGWAMRRRLAGVIGWRRSGAIVTLLAAEGRARLAAAADSHGPSRRGVIGGALAAAAGWALMPSSAWASSVPGGSTPTVTAADAAEVSAALATPAGQRAVRTWGETDAKAHKITSDGVVTLMLAHPQHGVVTFIRMSPGSSHTAVSLGAVPGVEDAIRYYTAGGTPLADLATANGRAQASPVPAGTARAGMAAPGETAEPDISIKAKACFIACIGRRAGGPCIANCVSCVAIIFLHKTLPMVCDQCVACAGQHAIACSEECGL